MRCICSAEFKFQHIISAVLPFKKCTYLNNCLNKALSSIYTVWCTALSACYLSHTHTQDITPHTRGSVVQDDVNTRILEATTTDNTVVFKH